MQQAVSQHPLSSQCCDNPKTTQNTTMSIAPRIVSLIDCLTSLDQMSGCHISLLNVILFKVLVSPVCSVELDSRAIMGDAGHAAFPLL